MNPSGPGLEAAPDQKNVSDPVPAYVKLAIRNVHSSTA